ncbi:MAG: PH domain-containing protein [Actinomycetales bacterium]|nr:PH domain-containing protein [Actinomycetales bacterium]
MSVPGGAAPEGAGVEQGPTTADAGEPVVEPHPLEWRRVHPVTPAIRSWKIFVGLIAVVSWQFVDNVSDVQQFVEAGGLRWVFLALGVIILLAAAYSALAWRFTRYAVGDEAVHLNTGIVFRQQRQARLDRLQSVDVVRPLLARLAGLSQLTLEVAGAIDSKVELAFLKDDEAMALRAEILAKAAGVRSGQPGSGGASGDVVGAGDVLAAGEGGPTASAGPLVSQHEEAPERTVIEVPVPRLLGSIALSGALVGVVVLVMAVVAGVVLTLTGQMSLGDVAAGNLIVLIPAVLGVVSVAWSQFSGGYGFRAAISPDGIRLTRGLLETRAQTIAPGRVQAIQLTQPFMWRKAGWWRVRMNVAGYGPTTEDSSTILLPVGDLEQALLACWLVLPDLGTEDAAGALTAAMEGSGEDHGFTLISRRVRFLSPLTFRRNGFLVTERALLLRHGRLRRQVQIVPHERTQSLGVSQGALARSLGVAHFTVHSVAGPVRPYLGDLDEAVAHRLVQEQAARAREARALDRPERWMEQ